MCVLFYVYQAACLIWIFMFPLVTCFLNYVREKFFFDRKYWPTWFLFWQADVDGDGTLNYGEFVAVGVHLRKMGNDEHLHKAFKYFDKNESGFIEIEELRDSLADELGANYEEVINAIIRDVDTDKVS